MKRYIAASYANTSIMHPEHVDGIQERVDAFLRHFEGAKGQAIDFYASIIATLDVMEKLTNVRTFYIALQWIVLHSIYSSRMGLNHLREETST